MSAYLPTFLAMTDALQGGSPTEAAGLPGLDMTRYAMVCMGLVVGILLLGWGFKRVLAGNLRMRAGQRSMKVVDVLPLGSKRQLAVVRCYDRTFVLGLGEREVNLVTELDTDEDVENALPRRQQEPDRATPSGGRFGGMLESAMARFGAGQAGRPAGNQETRPGNHAELVPAAPAAPAARLVPSDEPTPAPERTGQGDDLGLGRGLLG